MSMPIDFFLPAALTTITAIFGVVGTIFVFTTYKQVKKTSSEAEAFAYTAREMHTISNDIQNLPSRVTETLLPQLQGIYSQQQNSRLSLTIANLPEIIRSAGFQSFQPVAEDGSIIFVGSNHSGLKISLLFSIQDSDLVINSFSYWIERPPTNISENLLQMNALHKTGNIGIRKHGEKFVIFADTAIIAIDSYISIEALKASLIRQAIVQERVSNFLRINGCETHEILFNDYLTLGNADYSALGDLTQLQAQPTAAPA